MTMQQTDTVGLGEIKTSRLKTQVYTIANIGTSVAVFIYDRVHKVGGIAHIVLPESALASTEAPPGAPPLPGKFADLAIPTLVDHFIAEGGDKRTSVIRIVGGSQLFNFGGGGGNILNVGARNATAIQAALSKLGLGLEKSDIGGNKARSIRFVLATGQLSVRQIGGQEYTV